MFNKRSRKDARKLQRKEKKAKKNEFYANRNKTGKFVLNPEVKTKERASPMKKKDAAKRKMKRTLSVEDVQRKEVQEERRAQELLKKDMDRNRKRLLMHANQDEDKNIQYLEKQLKLNKRKVKGIPKSFTEDGLDYLLEVCDSDKMKGAAMAEQQINETNNEFEEDFALVTGNANKKGESLLIEDSDDFDLDTNDSDVEEEESEQGFNSDSAESDTNRSEKRQNQDNDDDNKTKRLKIDVDDCKMNENDSDEDDDAGNKQWEDIYGRIRNPDGSVAKVTEGKYIPPAVRARMATNVGEDKKRTEKLLRLQRILRGYLNKLAESNLHSIAMQIEELYMNNSRNDMNDTLSKIILDALISPVLSTERLLLEHVMLIAILHANVGTEIGAHFLQVVSKKFDEHFTSNSVVEEKYLDNTVHILAQMYNFKIFHAQLLYQILGELSKRFTEKDVECILLVFKNVGFTLRKDDAATLKDLVIDLQRQAASSTSGKDNPRVKYMLDILLAIKNNNMTKIPNYDPMHSERLKKLLKTLVRKGNYVTQLSISLDDLRKAEEKGKWWVVGSAWSGNLTVDEKTSLATSAKVSGYSQKLLDLAKKQRMNTDLRRNIFCILMSAEDYLDAFEKLTRLGVKNQQERDIVNILLHCCLQEKNYNAYYAVLAQKFCENDRKYQITIKYSVWDKLKTIGDCSSNQISNLAKLLTHLFLEKGLPISTLKIVEFSELDKTTLRFMRQVLLGILLCEEETNCLAVFEKVSLSDKLKMFRQSLRLFIHHFLLKNLDSNTIPADQRNVLEKRAKLVEKILTVNERKTNLY